MAISISATGFKGGLGSCFHSVAGEGVRAQPMMKNVNEGKGLFAPVVVVTRQIVGKRRFNQLRGKAIALHS
ncbi:hypothetical protein Godav_023652, partial [Gossypium davidsonii]|nr:hypothetical protein [Gossypium davidsonii]